MEFSSEQMFWLSIFGMIIVGSMWYELMQMLKARAGVKTEDKPLIHLEMNTDGTKKKGA